MRLSLGRQLRKFSAQLFYLILQLLRTLILLIQSNFELLISVGEFSNLQLLILRRGTTLTTFW